MTEQTLLLRVCVYMFVFTCMCMCVPHFLSATHGVLIGPLALQTEALFFISAWFCLLSSKQTLHIFLSSCRNYHLKPHTHTHAHLYLHKHTRICAWTHICKTNKTDRLWSLKKLLKMSASNFYSTHSYTHTCAHSFYFTQSIFSQSRFAYLFWCCLLFMSPIARCDPLALFILSLLKETLILLFLQQMGTGFLIAVKS